jgi:hypothetical protein
MCGLLSIASMQNHNLVGVRAVIRRRRDRGGARVQRADIVAAGNTRPAGCIAAVVWALRRFVGRLVVG